MIIGAGLTKSYTGEPLFENIDFKIGNGRKAALVGKNGCGKSTLFKIIIGEEDPDAGSISIEGESIGYIPQEITFKDNIVSKYLEKYLENPWDFYKVEKLVRDLEFVNFDRSQKIETLSEGQKMKLRILGALLRNPTILLIDEPTNHLDIDTKEVLEESLKDYKGTLLLISHDRFFVERTGVEKVLNLTNGRLTEY